MLHVTLWAVGHPLTLSAPVALGVKTGQEGPAVTTPTPKKGSTDAVKAAAIKKAAARAAAASTELENRAVPAGHVRSRGVKALLAQRQARKR